MKKLTYILLTLLFLNCKSEKKDIFQEYNGEMVKVEFIDSKADSLFTGFGGETYENGKLKSLSYIKNGQVSDTLFFYYENGNVKEKGLIKDNMKNGWWFFFDMNGRLKEKSEFVIVRDSMHKNQSYYFDKNRELEIEPSTYFELEIPDTLRIGKNAARIKNYVSNYNDREANLLSVIIDNEYSESEIKKDTFGDGTLKPFFGISIYRKGKQTIKGKIQEKVLTKTKDSTDLYTLTIAEHYKYFEKEVYVWDKENETEIGKQLREEMTADYKNN
jgi:hypothetical protein